MKVDTANISKLEKTKYSTYQNIEGEWIDQIPRNWAVKKVKYLISSDDGIKIGPFGSALKLDTLSDSGIKVYGQSNVIKDDFSLGSRYISEDRFEKQFKQYEILEGDVLITMMGSVGKSKVFLKEFEKGILDSHLLRLRFNKDRLRSNLFTIILQHSDYIFHQIRLKSVGSIMEGLNSSIVKEIKIITPPLREQTQIVSYLDRKTTLIDELIEKKQRKIELLKEKRTALINHTVTKGIDPDVKMKDSGVEWIGEIPEHWKITSLRIITQRIEVGIAEAATHAYTDSSDAIPILRSTNIKRGIIQGEILKITPEFAEKNKNKRLFTDDLVTVRTGNAGLTAVIPKEYNGCQCFTMLISTLTEDQNSDYFNYLLNSSVGSAHFEITAWGSAQKNISVPILGSTPVTVPPITEQVQISDYLNVQIEEIDLLIGNEINKINLLKEYRQSLISEVVTGKIKVTDE